MPHTVASTVLPIGPGLIQEGLGYANYGGVSVLLAMVIYQLVTKRNGNGHRKKSIDVSQADVKEAVDEAVQTERFKSDIRDIKRELKFMRGLMQSLLKKSGIEIPEFSE